MVGHGRQGTAGRDGWSQGNGALYGAVDLGTHNCRLLIAGADRHRGLRVVDALSSAARLGEGLAGSGRLTEAAMGRAIAALAKCQRRMSRLGVTRARAVATEACRTASNRLDFLDRVRAETGLDVQPISPAEESGLTLAGCAPLLDPARPRALLFDIGGGSTEVIWVDPTSAPGGPRILDLLSLPAGVLTLSETLDGEDGARSDGALSDGARSDDAGSDGATERPRLTAGAIDDALAAFDARHDIAHAIRDGAVQMIGTSGTVTTLAAVLLGLRRYRRTLVDGIEVDFDRVAALCRELAASDRATRCALPCVGPARADLLGAGCVLLAALYRRWPAARLTVADRGIREGILLRMLAEERAASAPGLAP